MGNTAIEYCEVIIKPIEEKVKFYRKKIKSRNIFNIINRKFYKKMLDEYEKILYEKHVYLSKIMDQN